MKLITCRTTTCAGKGAMLPASNAYPKGEPYLSARHVDRVYCARCKRVTAMSVLEFNRLPNLTLEDFAALAKTYSAPQLATLPTRDIEGTGFPREHAADLFKAGFVGGEDVAVLDRANDDELKRQEALAAPPPAKGRVQPQPQRGRRKEWPRS